MGIGAFLLAGLIGAACPGGSLQKAEKTFRKDIAPILAAKCIGCHQKGGSGPFSLVTFGEVRDRAELIRSVAILQKMPPTLAESDFGAVARFPKLTPSETVALQEWIRDGMKEGTGAPPIPPTPKDWPMGQPDLIVSPSAAVAVPAEGPLAVRTVEVELPLGETRYLAGFDLRPSIPQAARQALVALVERSTQDPFPPIGFDTDRLIGAWSLGYRPWRLPEGSGIRLAANQKLKVRVLYHPTGKPENGRFQLGLYFAKEPPLHEPIWRTVGTRDFALSGMPPAFTELIAKLRLERGYRLVSLVPEARALATHVSLAAKLGNEWQRTLLMLWRWDRRWPGAFNFPNGPPLTEGTELEAKFQYDNSTHGTPGLSLDAIKRLPNNPTVSFGPKDSDELFWMHVQLVADR